MRNLNFNAQFIIRKSHENLHKIFSEFVREKETAVIGGIGKLYSYVTEDTLHPHYKTPTAPAVLRTDR